VSYYSTLDVCKIIGIRRERLREWITRGFIHPLSLARGRGKKALFERSDIYKAALFKRLVERDISREMAGKMISSYVGLGRYENAKYIVFIFEGDKIIPMNFRDEKIFKSLKSYISIWDEVIIVNFYKLKTDVDNSLSKLE